ncbi:Lysine-specific demethylase 8 [Coccomyxa sp. Obi]|nr:Lysine-specific demethylase 8 [Coccomyxa sp. Obi]
MTSTFSHLLESVRASNELVGLYTDLEVVGGGPCISLIQLALEEQVGDRIERLTTVRIIKEAAWEKLHTGTWKDVHMAWRDLYSLGCLLHCVSSLISLDKDSNVAVGQSGTPHASSQSPQADLGDSECMAEGRHPAGSSECIAAEQDTLAAAMRDLDLAAIMGGLRFRPCVDAAIQMVQERHVQLSRQRTSTTAKHHVEGRQQHASRVEGHSSIDAVSERPRKQRRTVSNGGEHTEDGAVVAPLSEGLNAVLFSENCWPKDAIPHAVLPAGSLQHGESVKVVELPSLERFYMDYMCCPGGGKPCVITGAMQHWPALERWQKPEYLKEVAGLRTVPVELGDHYLQDGWGQSLMPLGEFIRQHVLLTGATQGNEGLVEARRGYLAQHPLFEQIPELARDILEPEYCSLGEGEMQSVNAWFGPPGTVTPLHHDPHHNLLAQVVGAKYVRLYPPSATPRMYPFEEGLTTNSSQVDLDAPDLARFPGFEGLPFLDTTLLEGQMLYIPPKWWHYVRSVSISFSVSFWWK